MRAASRRGVGRRRRFVTFRGVGIPTVGGIPYLYNCLVCRVSRLETVSGLRVECRDSTLVSLVCVWLCAVPRRRVPRAVNRRCFLAVWCGVSTYNMYVH
jgi:hypothetical protein